MIQIEKVTISGIENAIRAMRNPLDSWDKADSGLIYEGIDETPRYRLGESDMALALRLVRAGTDHSKFMRMIFVYADIIAPLYWWKEFDTYRAGVEKNSCSTMHTLHKKEITIADFSAEDLKEYGAGVMCAAIDALERLRQEFLRTQKPETWRAMIQLLPESYNQRRSVVMSFAALRNMFRARRFHKLKEWRQFCEWVASLDYSRLITEGISDDYG